MSKDNLLELRTSEKGPAQKIPITEIGGTVRVAVGEPGRRSSIWYVQAGKNSHCVYIFAQTLGGTQKFSLHQSGDWRYAFTSEFMEDPENTEFVDQLDDRVRDSWRRPEGEIVWGPSIRVRGEDVSALDDSALRRPQQVIWLPAPPVGSATAIDMRGSLDGRQRAIRVRPAHPGIARNSMRSNAGDLADRLLPPEEIDTGHVATRHSSLPRRKDPVGRG
jgi:hypothetical protein